MIVFDFSWDMKMTQEKSKTMQYANFLEVKEVYYGICENREYPRSSYHEALQLAKIARLEDRRTELCIRAFDKITKGGPLSKHLAPIRSIAHDYSLRNSKFWTSFKCKTECFTRSFLPSTVLMANGPSFKSNC